MIQDDDEPDIADLVRLDFAANPDGFKAIEQVGQNLDPRQ